MINSAFNRDCMEAMKEFPDGFFDLACVDPPYGISVTARHPFEGDMAKLVGGVDGHSAVKIHGGPGKGRPQIGGVLL